MYRRPVSPRRRRVRLSSTSSLVLLRSAPNNARQRKRAKESRVPCRRLALQDVNRRPRWSQTHQPNGTLSAAQPSPP